jgi:hypothetical protein
MEGTQPPSVVPVGSATLTADPTAPGLPAPADSLVSVHRPRPGSPVSGHSVTGCSCRLIVSTRGPDGMAVLADGGSAMMKSYVFECDISA